MFQSQYELKKNTILKILENKNLSSVFIRGRLAFLGIDISIYTLQSLLDDLEKKEKVFKNYVNTGSKTKIVYSLSLENHLEQRIINVLQSNDFLTLSDISSQFHKLNYQECRLNIEKCLNRLLEREKVFCYERLIKVQVKKYYSLKGKINESSI